MAYNFESDASKIRKNLNCIRIGSTVKFLSEVDSTNNVVKKYFLNGADEGLVAVAESQTEGRGRMGRIWHSPPETGVYLSVLLKPYLDSDHIPPFALLAGVSAVLTINEFSHQRASLKWPNDILINGKKICGLLCELVQNQREPGTSGLIIGIGINTNHLVEQFPEDLKNIATSLRIENGLPIDRLKVIRSLLINLDQEYQAFLTKGKQPMIEKWSLNSDLFGEKVSVNRGSTIITGTATRLNELGQLILRRDNGHEEALDSGEVTIKMH